MDKLQINRQQNFCFVSIPEISITPNLHKELHTKWERETERKQGL